MRKSWRLGAILRTLTEHMGPYAKWGGPDNKEQMMVTIYTMICAGVFCFQFGNADGKGFLHFSMTTIGLSLLGCAAATVLS